jgi:hypothetical protein
MPQNVPRRPPYWEEPAHPGLVQHYGDLLALYGAIREKLQPQIDKAFDDVARSIGFVVAVTLPVAVTVDDKGGVTGVAIGGEQFKGTLFDRELTHAFAPLVGHPIAGVGAGTYNIYAFWQAALTLLLQHHALGQAPSGSATASGAPKPATPEPAPWYRAPGIREPAHFLDARIQVAPDDSVLISAIDQAYPELRLHERISAARIATQAFKVPWQVEEMVPFPWFLDQLKSSRGNT